MLPRHVTIGSVDHRLLLDLDHPEHVEELRRDVLKLAPDDSLEIEEGLPGVDDAWLEGPDGHYVCELSVAVVQDPAKARKAPVHVRTPAPVPVPDPPTPPRELPARSSVIRPPGSEWLFLKLYTPKFLEEELIAGPIRKFARHAVERGLADDWFFIRYGDPDLHVRLRFRGDPAKLVSELAPAAFAWLGPLVEERICTRFTVDTYDREVERYGGPEGVRIAEAIFAADSVATADLLALPGRLAKADDRADLAVLTVTELLDGLGFDATARLAWLKGLGLAQSRADFAADYRQRRDRLVALLRAPAGEGGSAFGKDVADILARRRAALLPRGHELADAAAAGRLTQPTATLLRSHVHMHANRLLGPDTEAERRLYGVLVRTHESLKYERTPR
jgi:thiopeptide-type bacteriocin biosynthesis protein